MATNEVTWSPAVNTFDIPGARCINGTHDTSAQSVIHIGDSSGFSPTNTPTIAQLNASSGINQLIGYYNRRATTIGGGLSIMSYLTTADIAPTAAFWTTFLTNIIALRSAEGTLPGGSLTWPNSAPTVQQPTFGDHIAYLRQQLQVIQAGSAVSGDQWTRTYSVSGGSYVFSSDGFINRNLQSVGATGTASAAKVIRGMFTYTTVAGDVGKKLFFHATVAAVVGTVNPTDVYCANSILTSQFVMTGGSYIGSVGAAVTGAAYIDTGYVIAAAGEQYTFYWNMQNDIGSMIAVVGTFTNTHNFTNVGPAFY